MLRKVVLLSSLARGPPTARLLSSSAARPSQKLEFAQYGDPLDVLEQRQYELARELRPGEVRVRWHAAPVNPADLNMMQGVYGVRPDLPAVGGIEGVGVVQELAGDVRDLATGDHVVPSVTETGTWRSDDLRSAATLLRVPSELPVAAAATLLVNPPTAYRMLVDFVRLREGDTVVQNGANSGVGRAAIQIASLMGLRTVNVVRERADASALADELHALGANHVLTEEQFAGAEGKALMTSVAPPRLALNGVGGKSAMRLATRLAPGGVLVTYGGMSKEPLIGPTGPFIFKDIQFRGFWISRWFRQAENAPELRRMIDELSAWIMDGSFRAPPTRQLPINDYKTAVETALTGASEKQLIMMA